jgi:hypothetical protein
MTVLVIGTTAVYAEDAVVLPRGTLRDADAAIGFVHEGFDGNSKKVNALDAVIAGATLGLAYGFTGL